MKRDLFCDKCSLQFDKKYVFDLHLSSVHGEKIKVKVESPICEENLQQSQISESKFSYQSVHENERPFKCNMCYASFAQKRDLKGHMASAHEGKKTCQCIICDAKFTLKSSLKNHKESVHEGKKPFHCDICNATFAQNSSLKVHSASVHGNNKPFKCDI